VGRLTPALRRVRADARCFARSTIILRRPIAQHVLLRDVAIAARDAGRSCYFRPLFDRPRHWAAQRTPRPVPTLTAK
jgi:hypothetical protein